MEYRVLGPLEVLDPNGHRLSLGGARQQSVLASLLLRAGQTVALDRLVDELWERPPATASRTVQAYVSRLRHTLPVGAIESHPGGYRFVLDDAELDLDTFERQAEEGHAALAAEEFDRAASLLGEALALWRGPALAGLTSAALRREAARLEELRLSVLEDRIEADIGTGRDSELVPELKALVAEHSLRERLRAQLMRALYRSGRPGDALALYREGRRLLVEELGMEPSQELRELEQAILRQDAELERSDGGARSPTVSGTVTFLFTDIEGSTQLLRTLGRARYADVLAEHGSLLRAAFGEYNGEVIDTQGDAFFVAFRSAADAVSAAAAAQRSLQSQEWEEGLSLAVRMGLHTGEAALTDDRYLGLAVHLAARIGAAAHGGQVLLSDVTRSLVEDELPAGVELRDLGEQRLKDIERPVRLHQLGVAGLPAEFPPLRTGETAFLGREDELAAEAGVALRRRRRKRLLLLAAGLLVLAAAIAGTLVAITGGSGLSSLGPTSLGVIDPTRNKLVGEIRLGFKSSLIAAGEGHIWVVDPDRSTLVKVDPRTHHVDRLGVQASGKPIGLALGHGAVWLSVLRETDKFVLELDPQFGDPRSEIPVGGGLTFADDAIWVTDEDSGSLWRINPQNGHRLKLAEGLSASSVAITPEAAWVAGLSGLTKIDALTGVPLDEIELSPPGEVGSVAVGLGAVWFTSSAVRKLWRIDPQFVVPTRTFPVGKGPSALTVGAGAVWSANSRDGSVTRVDRQGNVDTIRTGSAPAGLVAAYGKVWITSGDPR